MQAKTTNRLWTLVEMLVLCLLTVAATGCATMQRLVPGFEKRHAKSGIQLLLAREGYTNNLSQAETDQLVDWVYEDYENNAERQKFLNEIASRKQNEAVLLGFADKYFAGGDWSIPAKDQTAAEPAGANDPFTAGAHKGKAPAVDPAVKLRSVTLIGSKLHFDHDPLPWTEFEDSGKTLRGWVARLNATSSGTFDMCRERVTPRSLENIHHGYGGQTAWTKNEWVCLVNKEGTKRSNWVKVQQ